MRIFDQGFKLTAITLIVSFLCLGVVLTYLPEATPPPTGKTLDDRTCITGGWKLALVLTHVLAFVIMPVAMKVFYESLRILSYPTSSIFAAVLGLAFIMVAIAAEIGWHVTTCWYYQDNFTMLNFTFYFFLLSAFALWSDGLVVAVDTTTERLNLMFALLLISVSVLYPIGYAVDNSEFKTPIYIALAVIFVVLTIRGYNLLDSWDVLWFPFFAVGVNLVFVALLQNLGDDQYTNPKVKLNALYHILHDLAGTETGVVVFTWLVYKKGQDGGADPARVALVGE